MSDNSVVIQKDVILLKDQDYFGKRIRKGSTFKKVDSDWYQLYENIDGIIMHCPEVELHFTIVIDAIKKGYFVEQYSSEEYTLE